MKNMLLLLMACMCFSVTGCASCKGAEPGKYLFCDAGRCAEKAGQKIMALDAWIKEKAW